MSLCRLLRSTIVLKFLAAISGAALLGFTIIHMLGNLQIFLSPEKINHYGYLLKSNLVLLWGFRLGLLAMVVIHLFSVITLTLRNKEARPVDYEDRKALGASLASRTMFVSGIILLAFIIFHLLHFTLQVTNPEFRNLDASIPGVDHPVHDIYRMVVLGFSNPVIAIFYIISVGILCVHLSHGTQSMFRSVGLSTNHNRVWQTWLAWTVAIFLFLGFASVPTAVLFGFVK